MKRDLKPLQADNLIKYKKNILRKLTSCNCEPEDMSKNSRTTNFAVIFRLYFKDIV